MLPQRGSPTSYTVRLSMCQPGEAITRLTPEQRCLRWASIGRAADSIRDALHGAPELAEQTTIVRKELASVPAVELELTGPRGDLAVLVRRIAGAYGNTGIAITSSLLTG